MSRDASEYLAFVKEESRRSTQDMTDKNDTEALRFADECAQLRKKDKLRPFHQAIKDLASRGCSSSEIGKYLERQHGVSVTPRSVQRLLKRMMMEQPPSPPAQRPANPRESTGTLTSTLTPMGQYTDPTLAFANPAEPEVSPLSDGSILDEALQRKAYEIRQQGRKRQ